MDKYIVIGKVSKKGQNFEVVFEAKNKVEAQERFLENFKNAIVIDIKKI